MFQKIITIVLGLVVVGGLVWYIDKNYVSKSSDSDQNPSTTTTQNSKTSQASLVFVNRSSISEIFLREPVGKTKKLYTDSDETFKIKMLSGLSGGGKVLAVVSENSVDKLVLINLANSEKKTLKESFPLPANLSISPDGKWFTYTRFSNVEAKYGYTLFLEQIDGPKIEEIANSPSEIVLPAWDKLSKTIYFGKTSGTNTEITAYNIETKKTANIDTIQDTVDWISVGDSDKIILSVRKAGAKNAGEIIFLSLPDKNKTSILKFSGGKAGFVYLSSSGELSYLVAQYAGSIDAKTSGQIYILNINNSAKSAVQKGTQILGWWVG